jgi:CubicO group peptidase (beta-lactamase class C family)
MIEQLRSSKRYLFNAVKAAAFILLLLGPQTAPSAIAEPIFPGKVWERADPAKLGWSLTELRAARDYAREIGSKAVMIVQDGRVVASWGDMSQKVAIHSVRKSLMSALYGIAVAKRQIDLNKTMAELGIDDRPRLTAKERQATVRNLLMARSGIYHEAAYETKSMKENRPERGSHAPGTFWFYNNWDFNALGTILRNATGEDTFAAVERSFARPLQMQDFTASDGKYVNDKGSEHPAYTMEFTARDLARFGWLYLNQGRWGNRQIVSAEWVAESTRSYSSDARAGIGYGYLWWVSEKDKQFGTMVGPGAFSARGSGGQYIIVVPAHRIVVVHLNDLHSNERLGSKEMGNLLKRIFAAVPQ